jgi:2-oxoglutarate dehydrogenase E2 component (dihydrolipoamide succinyltransferase)
MISIKVPPLGESIVEATVSRWLKKKGDSVASGDTIVELQETRSRRREEQALQP